MTRKQFLTLKPDKKTPKAIDEQLGRLAAIERNRPLRSGMRRGAKVIAKRWKQLLPTSGKWSQPMADTIKEEVHYLTKTSGMFVKVRSTARHAHLPELGHEIKSKKGGESFGRVEGKHHGEQAKNEKLHEAQTAIVEGVKKAVEAALK